ncbi:MAG: phospholipase D-like domain-containing protein [Verrucomicrobiales bacterium]|nr:phospholipase D-like domain-containing protein [Verrucomicrobiales bacterium]
MNWLDDISRFWPHFVAGFDFIASALASCHALLHKRDSRATTLWIGVIWLMPVLGPVLYLALGVNRIRRRALSLGVHQTISRPVPEDLGEPQHDGAEHLKMLARVVGRVVERPLTPGNKIQPLVNGDEAFPAMLAAIESAEKSISLCTYIFDNDPSGHQFADAISRAVQRGVEVRVLIDAAGTRYSWPPITRILKREKIPFARFLPSSLFAPWRVATINLRNHRKVLVVDGQMAFTGGMNIRHGNILGTHISSLSSPKGGEGRGEEADNSEVKTPSPCLGGAREPAPVSEHDLSPTKNAVQDLHFRVEGPVVTRLQEAFANDWAFTTGEILDGDLWFPELKETGNVIARIITDGPDADYDKLRWTLLAALAEAQTSVQILTPYFLPDTALVTALNLAALRGVRVDIILPAKNNLPFVHWASRSLWWQVLERGCHVWLTPPPFDHSKLMIVDGHWVFLGSANWDARSLRLNFELNVECYGRDFADEMELVIERKIRDAREVTLAEVDARTVPGKLRDAIARLFSPYL